MSANLIAINEPSPLGTADWRKVMMWIFLRRANGTSDLGGLRQ